VSGEQWERVKSAFDAVLQLPESERAAFVNQQYSDDAEVLARVLELLANYSDTTARVRRKSDYAPLFHIGQIVSRRFRILRFLHRGGMGEVYQAYDMRLSVCVALKTLRPDLMSENGAIERFQREIRIAREVAHDNLCRVFEFVEHQVGGDEVIPCIIMEFIDGETLADHLQTRRPLHPDQALPIVKQIAAALDILHASNIVHRDLKPSNVMLTSHSDKSLRAVVMDFGLARTDGETELFESNPNFHLGAPYFMSPESLRGENASAASDIYAFGLLIDEMVTCRRAFSVDSIQSLYFAKLWEDPIPPDLRSANLPAPWVAAILTSIRRQPSERFRSAMAVVDAICAS
jgi:serine/threonine protein kinase